MENFEENLIACVKEHDFLYNTKSKKYKNVVNRDSAWVKIGEQLNRPTEECKQRWKSLRDRFVREKKKLEQPSGSSAKKLAPWELYPVMEFLNESLKTRRQVGNHETIFEENSEQDVFCTQDDLDDLSTPTLPNRQNRRPRSADFPINEFFGNLSDALAKRFNTPAPELDENDMFMNMLSKKMKILPEESKIRLQAKMLKVVNDELLDLIQNK